MSPAMDLPGPRAKLSRALELRGELAKYIEQMLGPVENRPSLALRVDDATREYILYADDVPDLSPLFTRVGLLVGDVVHNIRSALDHLVYQLALINAGGNVARPDRTQFPIRDSRSRFDQAAATDLAEVAPNHRDVIEGFQPYHPMEENIAVGPYFHPLAMLRDLSNTDKHRILTPVLIASTHFGMDRPVEWIVNLVMDYVARYIRGELKAEAMVPELVLARFPPPAGTAPAAPQRVGHALPMVAFEDGRTVVDVLDKIARAVEHVISTFGSLGNAKSESGLRFA